MGLLPGLRIPALGPQLFCRRVKVVHLQAEMLVRAVLLRGGWGGRVVTNAKYASWFGGGADLTANGRDAGRHLADELRRALVMGQSDE